MAKTPTANDIKDALWACQTLDQVNATSSQFAIPIIALGKGTRHDRVMKIHIDNMISYLRTQIRAGQWPVERQKPQTAKSPAQTDLFGQG